MSRNEDLLARHQAALMPTYAPQPVALVRGEGPYVWDADGNRYLDLIGGIAVNVLGHNHPALVAAVTAQMSKIAHASNLFVNEPSVLLAERLRACSAATAGCSSPTPAPRRTSAPTSS
jgi:acetylornithine/N-succinyldiaminopimelate aminotransferase